MRLHQVPVGRIVNTHGIRGEVRVLPRDGDPAFLTRFHTLYMDGVPVTVEAARVHKGCALLRLAGVNDMDAAQALKGRELSIDRADAADVPFFDDELPGMEVFDAATGECIGTLTKVEAYPASKVYTVRGEHTYLIPAVPDAFILSVDVDGNRMDVRVWEGLAQDVD
ncbi:MAG: 16S rRNA processing protein RimM [Oscillospiraceae bacterium]|nr:16S rRNA processing protein RimM [Oscillospiraceae bacterium]